MKVELPYPHPDLSPNGRVNHFALARRKKAYRTGCGWECVSQGVKPITADRLNVTVTFRPPNRHHRDVDNALASIKSGLDALSDALGVDDSQWAIRPVMGEPVKFGRVIVEWEAME